MNNSKLNMLVNIWYLITIFVLILLGIKFALPVLLPFILATIVAVLIRKPVNRISEMTKLKRDIVSFAAVTIVTLLLILLLSLLIYSIYAYLSSVLTELPQLLPKLTLVTQQISDIFNRWTNNMPESITDALMELPSRFISTLTTWLTGALANIAKKLPSIVISVGVTIFASFLITRDYYKLGNFLSSIIPKSAMDKIIRYREIAGDKSFGMIKGYTALTVITYTILLVGFLLLGISYAPAIAAIVAFIDFLPVLGTGVILIPWSVICIFNGDFFSAIGLMIIYVVATVARNVLSPKVLGNQIKLDSLTVLISMYVGYEFFGIVGLIFAPFVASTIRDILMEQ